MKVEKYVELENGTKKEDVVSITAAINDSDIRVTGFCAHTKASEKYVVATFNMDGRKRIWVIPYQYRRTDTFIDTKQEMVSLLRECKPKFAARHIDAFKHQMKARLSELFGENAVVTRPIFEMLLGNCGNWILNKNFDNSNSQRRIQDIKETGFTIATKLEGRKTFHMLLPFPPVKSATYETIPLTVRKRIFKVHGGINAYTGELATLSCLPDHKFPEIRWDKDTPASNENLTHEEMREKFQIVPENINQMKREMCRKCFQYNKRGMLNGIKFFYAGNENWDSSIPKRGKKAESGCVGCFWYDMLAWRKALNQKLGE